MAKESADTQSLRRYAETLPGVWEVVLPKETTKKRCWPNRIIWDTTSKNARIVTTRGKRGHRGKFAVCKTAVEKGVAIEKKENYTILLCMAEPGYDVVHEFSLAEIVEAWKGITPRNGKRGYEPWYLMDTDKTVILERKSIKPLPCPF